MACSDDEWVQDIISAMADIRANTTGMDLAAFKAKPTIVRSVLYSIAVIGEAASCGDVIPSYTGSGRCVRLDCFGQAV